MKYNSEKNYFSFFAFRDVAKRYFNDLFFLHDVGYLTDRPWRIWKKPVHDVKLAWRIAKRSIDLGLWWGVPFSIGTLAVLSIFGFYGWIRK